MKIKYILLIVSLNIIFTFSYAQEEKEEVEDINLRKISLTQLMNEINNCTESAYILSETEIIPSKQDKALLQDKIFYTPYILDGIKNSTKSIYFYDCIFSLPNNAPLIFKRWNIKKLNIVNTTFSSSISFEDCTINPRYTIKFENDIFKNKLSFTGDNSIIKRIKFEGCAFYHSLKINTNPEQITFLSSTFSADSTKYTTSDEESSLFQLDMASQNIGEIIIDRCDFTSNTIKNLYSINFNNTEFEKVTITGSKLEAINFTDASINKAFLIDSTNTSNYIAVRNFDFPEENTNIPWENLKGEKFCLFTTVENTNLIIPYKTNTDKEISQTLLFNDLMSAYNKFNTMYQTRGDKPSANGCYIEIKDIETKQQKYLYNIDKNFNNLISYKLNIFLKYYSDYATNPARSLIVSLYIILIFAFIFLFIYTDWDNINHKTLVEKYKNLVYYFTSDKNIKDFFVNELHDELNDFATFKTNFIDKQKKIPSFIRFWGLPLFYSWSLKNKIIIGTLDRLEILNGSWTQLSTKRKLIAGTIVSFIILFYVIYVIIIKAINSIILSLNTFITIGFGEIPVKGLSMYVSIIEGFLGWFMLAIFSITLLAQVLQNF